VVGSPEINLDSQLDHFWMGKAGGWQYGYNSAVEIIAGIAKRQDYEVTRITLNRLLELMEPARHGCE
jgi:hypothetical protein